MLTLQNFIDTRYALTRATTVSKLSSGSTKETMRLCNQIKHFKEMFTNLRSINIDAPSKSELVRVEGTSECIPYEPKYILWHIWEYMNDEKNQFEVNEGEFDYYAFLEDVSHNLQEHGLEFIKNIVTAYIQRYGHQLEITANSPLVNYDDGIIRTRSAPVTPGTINAAISPLKLKEDPVVRELDFTVAETPDEVPVSQAKLMAKTLTTVLNSNGKRKRAAEDENCQLKAAKTDPVAHPISMRP